MFLTMVLWNRNQDYDQTHVMRTRWACQMSVSLCGDYELTPLTCNPVFDFPVLRLKS